MFGFGKCRRIPTGNETAMSGKYRYTLLITVSAAAMMMSVERGPLAADLTPAAQAKWWASVEGQYLLYDGDSADYGFEDKDADHFHLKPDDGWGIGGELGFRPADSPWSFVGRVRYGESNKEHDDSTYYTTFTASRAKADHREHQIIADLEIGRDVGLGALDNDIRVFAGIRFANFKGKGSYSNNYSGFVTPTGSDVDIRREFTGIGPRIGFDATLPLGDQFGLDIGAAGAALFGKQKFDADGTAYSGFLSTQVDDHRSKRVVVPNLEASAALSWLITDNAKFSLGYRVDSYFDVYDNGDINGSRDEGDRIIHGPFVKFTIGGGGG
jgi:hypothetical protein